MNYSVLAGVLVTLSFVFLALERSLGKGVYELPKVFTLLYALGVFCWLLLGVAINSIPLVVISALQAFFLSLAYPLRKTQYEDK